MPSFSSCPEVTPECPVSDTAYGYRPNLGACLTFLIIFATCTIAQLVLGIRYRLRAFLVVTTLGRILETVGHVGRLLLYNNPWSSVGFRIQIVCLILGPSFLAAGIYLSLKHLVLHFGLNCSILPAHLYPWVFVGCDAVSIAIQAAGGGLAATARSKLLDIRNDMLIAGIAFQVATMAGHWILAADAAWRLSESKPGLMREGGKSIMFYLAAQAIAFLTIFIRCLYRLPEMAGGWGSKSQRNESEFLILDGAMIAIATLLMSVAHPGIFFPEISSKFKQSKLADMEKTSSEI